MLQVNNGRVDIRGIVEIFDVEWPLQNLAFTDRLGRSFSKAMCPMPHRSVSKML
ncbi:hypothetical protein F9C07_10633 [Aspergillus flavus]|uniref:Uncharacterized protein n=1 Tax=Aspergillus flavus (strain ATCC 200026 / FGSC A1120 / IAM 13836 / NRRL 3357 / JCM 12722 / SRRC 167) TaxID=332952 RepID=A0A7U2MV98_ASPFN|nr:hypothetical protein F9C07_10633 [Aspergillus flavus]